MIVIAKYEWFILSIIYTYVKLEELSLSLSLYIYIFEFMGYVS